MRITYLLWSVLVASIGLCSFPSAYSGSPCKVSYTVRRKSCTSWFFGIARSCRRKAETKYKCCEGWGSTNCDMPICRGGPVKDSCSIKRGEMVYKNGNVVRDSGGTCEGPGTCTNCNYGYFVGSADKSYCDACKQIDNCNLKSCTTYSDTVCDWCVGERIREIDGENVFTGKRDNTSCQRACSWEDGYRCFPGTCKGDLLFSQCRCSPGFGGHNCATATRERLPSILEKILKLEGEGYVKKLIMDIPTANGKYWTNEPSWKNITVFVSASYKPEIDTSNIPPYILDYKIGVKELSASMSLIRQGRSSTWFLHGNGGYNERFEVEDAKNLRSIPWNSILTGGYPEPFYHADTITFTTSVKNGGYVDYVNRETGANLRYYINGISTELTFELGFDFVPPKHCYEDTSPCRKDALDVTDFSTEQIVHASWDGWSDDDSGVDYYAFNVYYLEVFDHQTGLLENKHMLEESIVDYTESWTTLNLTAPGPYSVEIIVYDRAGNYKVARRIILFDDNSVVDKKGDVPVVAQANDYFWITEDSETIDISWSGRYINHQHHDKGWLNAVKETAEVKPDLDDIKGISRRSIEEFHNIDGVVRFDVAYDEELQGELTHTAFFAVSQTWFDYEKVVLRNIILDEGKRLTFYIRGVDAVESYAQDNVTVMVDLSPPVVENLWITKGDILNLSVHNLLELEELTFEWEAFDIHSGLLEVYWRLFDNFTNTDIVHGQSFERPQGQTQTLTECSSTYSSYPRGPQCYCSPYNGCYHKHFQVNPQVTNTGNDGLHHGMEVGVHDSDYFLEVTVVNNARLKTVATHKITIDTSPPHEGSVHEGLEDEPEVDYQQSLDISAHWKGFFDRESGVWFYLYTVAPECKTSVDLDIHNQTSQVIKTYETNIVHHVASTGKYYVTVVAYNHALDPSEAVCSDGIIVDTTQAIISEVVVHGAIVQPGLIKDNVTNAVYLMYPNREVQQLLNVPQECIDRATPMSSEELALFPHVRLHNGSHSVISASEPCTSYNAAPVTVISYITSASHIEVSWNVTMGDSGVHDFYIGIATESTSAPNVMDFTSTHGQQTYRLYHPHMFNGEEFYLLVKTVSKSDITTSQTIGPFLLDAIPPSFNGDLNVYKDVDGDEIMLIVEWQTDSFTDMKGLHSTDYKAAIGTEPYGTDILGFQTLSNGGACVVVPHRPNCTAIDVSLLPWHLHGNQKYYFTIKAVKTSGLFVLATSEPYLHNVQLASIGVVFDTSAVPSAQKVSDDKDIDYQTNSDTLSCTWSGFEHPHEVIVFYVCLTNDSRSDFIICDKISHQNSHTFSDLHLIPYKTYYHVVIGETLSGNVTAVSDGITVVVEDDHLSDVTIQDGSGCSGNYTHGFNLTTLHHVEVKMSSCEEDVDFQSSTSVLQAHWKLPANMTDYIHDVYWAVEQRAPVADVWVMYEDFQLLDSVNNVLHAVNIVLSPGRSYRIIVKFCAGEICYSHLRSNGVTIVPRPPSAGNLTVLYNEQDLKLEVTLDKFYDPDIEDIGEAREAIHHYEWVIADDSDNGRLITKWKKVDNGQSTTEQIKFQVQLDSVIRFTKCWRLSVRGYNKAGVYSTVSTEILKCEDINNVRPNVVIDAVGDREVSGLSNEGLGVFLEENDVWPDKDVDFTAYTNVLSAVWPTLRHNNYTWAVLEVQEEDPSVFYSDVRLLNLTEPCSHPDAITCGQTAENFVNVFFDVGFLHHGHRYIVCVYTNATDITYEFWTQHLEEVAACSDGVTVDVTAPEPADVWLGLDKTRLYQVSVSELVVNWNSFIDVEEERFTAHTTGIRYYTVKIGSDEDLEDVVPEINVGLTNTKTFHDLHLHNGHVYYATVTGVDHTGLRSKGISEGFMVDTTPPVETNKTITINGRYITSMSYVQACWIHVFEDRESGIAFYEWYIGSKPGTSDVMSNDITLADCAETPANANVSFKEGHAYYITVKAFNKGGLFSVATSWAFLVDVTPPNIGRVYDGPKRHSSKTDLDYTTNHNMIQAYWYGFTDPHTGIKEYFASVGTCQHCDDVIANQTVGLKQDIEIDMEHLVEGTIYYTTITSCNPAGLCSSSTSDGFIVDVTPPAPGHVLDGILGNDINYQGSSVHAGCKWYGFKDTQSSISHYVWRLGTRKGTDDILAATNVYKEETGFIVDVNQTVGFELPVDTPIYCTVRAFDKAGLYIESVSNGFIVDISPPEFTTPLSLSTLGSIIPGTSVLRSILRVEWDVLDKQSHIEVQYLSILSHTGGDFNSTNLKIEGLIRDYTFTNLDLHDGSYYEIKLVSCNGAQLCSESFLNNVLVDSSPPTAGTWAINTDHASVLNRQPEDWMTWTPISVSLAWLGFHDIHTGIDHYILNIGSKYMASDLNINPGEPYLIAHDHSTNISHQEDGFVQTVTLRTKSLTNRNTIYVSIKAINQVGLSSDVVHSQFNLLYGGLLALVRRCDSHSCLGHCVCSPHGKYCRNNNTTCNDMTHDSGYKDAVEVIDYTDLTFTEPVLHPRHTPANTMLAASWSLKDSVKIPFMYEWSVGLSVADLPEGVFDERLERVWHEAGNNTAWVFTLPKGKVLADHIHYSFFVRAWFDVNTFAIYKSPGVLIYTTPPKTTSLRGRAVKERLARSNKDVDFIAKNMEVLADWSGKFINTESSLARFHLYLSTVPGGHDVGILSTTIPASSTSYNLTGLAVQEYTKYYTTVQGYNHAGLHTTVVSDGFMIDNTPPTTGNIRNGYVPPGVHAFNNTDTIQAFWYAFSDLGSGIKSYDICVTSHNSDRQCDVIGISSVAIATRFSIHSKHAFQHGQLYMSQVRAIDAANHVSQFVSSPPAVIDTSPPIRVNIKDLDNNVVTDGSFENLTPSSTCSNLTEWSIGSSETCVLVDQSTHAQDGHNLLILQGSITQNLTITEPGKYQLSFYTSTHHANGLVMSANEGFVDIDNDMNVFLLYNKPIIQTYSWQKHTVVLNLVKGDHQLTFGTINKHSVYSLDNVKLEKMIITEEMSDTNSHIRAHSTFIHDWSSIHADWHFVDDESGIQEILWGIGTIQGGTQLQPFTSVGRRTFGFTSSLKLDHNTEVHVTVVAVNGAGLQTVSYSQPVYVDLTPPEFLYLYDGTTHGLDIDFQATTVFGANWNVIDTESGIQSCVWAIETVFGQVIKNFTSTSTDPIGMASYDIGSYHDDKLFIKIKCTNGVGLTKTASTDGVHVIENPPQVDDVILEVMTSSITEYPARGIYHGDPTKLKFRWKDFNKYQSISSYYVMVEGQGVSLSEIVSSSDTSDFEAVSFTNIHLPDGQYTVSVTAINGVQMQSARKQADVYVLTSKPNTTGSDIQTSWNKGTRMARAVWGNVFQLNHPLYYEVTMQMPDQIEGDLLQWQETTNSFVELEIDPDKMSDTTGTLEIIVRAISYCGLHTTKHAELLVTL